MKHPINMITIAVNPKEYFEFVCDKGFNKKHKGVWKDTAGMTFEAYADRIIYLKEHSEEYKKPKRYM